MKHGAIERSQNEYVAVLVANVVGLRTGIDCDLSAVLFDRETVDVPALASLRHVAGLVIDVILAHPADHISVDIHACHNSDLTFARLLDLMLHKLAESRPAIHDERILPSRVRISINGGEHFILRCQ